MNEDDPIWRHKAFEVENVFECLFKLMKPVYQCNVDCLAFEPGGCVAFKKKIGWFFEYNGSVTTNEVRVNGRWIDPGLPLGIDLMDARTITYANFQVGRFIARLVQGPIDVRFLATLFFIHLDDLLRNCAFKCIPHLTVRKHSLISP